MYLISLHFFQVGIVLMSILCHIWKIVPDLYEAIQKMSSHSGDNNNVTFIPIPNCSVQSPENEVRITKPQWYIWGIKSQNIQHQQKHQF